VQPQGQKRADGHCPESSLVPKPQHRRCGWPAELMPRFISVGAEWPSPALPSWPPRSRTGSRGRPKTNLFAGGTSSTEAAGWKAACKACCCCCCCRCACFRAAFSALLFCVWFWATVRRLSLSLPGVAHVIEPCAGTNVPWIGCWAGLTLRSAAQSK